MIQQRRGGGALSRQELLPQERELAARRERSGRGEQQRVAEEHVRGALVVIVCFPTSVRCVQHK